MKEINFNAAVKVKLTDFGVAILKNRHEEIKKAYESAIPDYMNEFTINIDENGYTEFRLWELAQIFGPYLGIGENNVPFDNDVCIYEKDLTDKTFEDGKKL